MQSSTSRCVVIWFRNDLRTIDNPLLHHKALQSASTIIGVCCDSSSTKTHDRTLLGKAARRFRKQAAADLGGALGRIPLYCYDGPSDQVLPAVVGLLGPVGTVIVSDTAGTYEKKDEEAVRGALPAGWEMPAAVWGYSLFHPDDLPFAVNMTPDTFTTARNKIEKARVPVRDLLPVPKVVANNTLKAILEETHVALQNISGYYNVGVPPVKSSASQSASSAYTSIESQFIGGQTAALARLEAFCETGLATYKTTRNESIGWDYSSKLSPWLAAGCISPRQVRKRIAAFEMSHGGETVDTYWMTFELLVRDHNRFLCEKYGAKLFHEFGPVGDAPKGIAWRIAKDLSPKEQDERLQAWVHGRTGVPWVDGHMRELTHTGFMSNRGRQNVASFLVHDLGLDWRLGARHFQQTLIDHDVSANWVNWAVSAGVMSKQTRVSVFNVDKQARQYDPEGKHATMWIPELPKEAEGAWIHELGLRNPKPIRTSPFDSNPKSSECVRLMGVEVNGSSSSSYATYPLPIVKVRPAGPAKGGHGGNKKGRAHRGASKTFVTT